jgi:hypothetical protein
MEHGLDLFSLSQFLVSRFLVPSLQTGNVIFLVPSLQTGNVIFLVPSLQIGNVIFLVPSLQTGNVILEVLPPIKNNKKKNYDSMIKTD